MARSSELWDRFQAAMSGQDLEGVVSLFAPDGVYTSYGVAHEGRDGIRGWLGGFLYSFSDVRFDTGVVVQDGDVTIAEWRWHGVQSGPLTMPDGSVLPASGRTLEGPGVTVLRADHPGARLQRPAPGAGAARSAPRLLSGPATGDETARP